MKLFKCQWNSYTSSGIPLTTYRLWRSVKHINVVPREKKDLKWVVVFFVVKCLWWRKKKGNNCCLFERVCKINKNQWWIQGEERVARPPSLMFSFFLLLVWRWISASTESLIIIQLVVVFFDGTLLNFATNLNSRHISQWSVFGRFSLMVTLAKQFCPVSVNTWSPLLFSFCETSTWRKLGLQLRSFNVKQ